MSSSSSHFFDSYSRLDPIEAKFLPGSGSNSIEDERENSSKVLNDSHSNSDSDILVSLSNVHKTYILGLEGIPALRGINLEIRRGELILILGTSGGGKVKI